MKYAFVGGGNMGSAMAAALVNQHVCNPAEILVVEPDEAARARCADLKLTVSAALNEQLRAAPVVVLAVKPQTAPQVYPQLKPLLRPAQVVVSIMAGVSLAGLRAGLNHEALVRVMPNTPAQVAMGMNVYYPAPPVQEGQLAAVEALLRACGEVLRVRSEDAIDAATAVSGSGPAYVFYLAEHWLAAAQGLGFSADEAQRLVQQTLAGATALWKAQGIAVGTLRERVTSKGGTTAAALDVFNGAEMGGAIERGVRRAYERAKELGA
ncbi:MAG: pyrroline-5-carboxylate reductase [Candidatus Lambdaproteobacteria bacterium]|nr:pyrroline-5-carboxylate reductase [Candidatus Lambdaproteobacteria bacterium]